MDSDVPSIARINPKRGFLCYPSYSTLARETSLSMTQLRVVIRALEADGWIKRQKRSRDTNVFHINAAKLIALAEANRKTLREEKDLIFPSPDGFLPTVGIVNDAEPDKTDRLESDFKEELTDELFLAECPTHEDVFGFACSLWPDHPSVIHPRSIEFLKKDLAQCIELSGSPIRCGQILSLIQQTNQRAYESVARSSKLGLYLVKCFPCWLKEYELNIDPIETNASEEE